MEIKRINTYEDSRFSQRVLRQHGCFLVDGAPCEVEIVSDHEAVIRGADPACYGAVMEEFRFYAPHITRFYDEGQGLVKEFPAEHVLTIPLEQIQPSQFYVSTEKIEAISSFIQKPEDIMIQVLPSNGRYLSLDGHTRLYLAVMRGWTSVRAVCQTSDDWIYRFVEEAQRRGIFTPKDMVPLGPEAYEEKWNGFCDAFFAEKEEHKVEIKPYQVYHESEVLPLYASVGWNAYTDNPEALREGFAHSLLVLAAYEDGELCGLVRAVGDGHTVVLIQDLLVHPAHQRRGIGKALMQAVLERYAHVRQMELATDDTPGNLAFYRALGFRDMREMCCCGMMKG